MSTAWICSRARSARPWRTSESASVNRLEGLRRQRVEKAGPRRKVVPRPDNQHPFHPWPFSSGLSNRCQRDVDSISRLKLGIRTVSPRPVETGRRIPPGFLPNLTGKELLPVERSA
jgi:hypothetical protein